MNPDILVPIVIVFIVVGLPVMAGTLLALAKILKGGGSAKSSGAANREETELMQDIHRSLSRLEKRIDSLETIVLEKSDR